MPSYIIILTIILGIFTVEAISWLFCLDRHVSWIKEDEDEHLIAVKGIRIRISILYCIVFLFIVWAWYCYVATITIIQLNTSIFTYYVSFIICGMSMIAIIHMGSLLARYMCLPLLFWPILSKIKYNILLYFDLNDPFLSYCKRFRKWRKYDIDTAKHQSLLVNFLDHVPALVWTKDMNGKYVYVNRSMQDKLLILPEQDIIGRTDKEIKEILKNKNINHTFEKICFCSDNIIKDIKEISVFIETGIANDEFLALNVIKAPIYECKKGRNTMIGVIGIGRDVTIDWKEHEQILAIWEEGNEKEAYRLFVEHKSRFENAADRYNIKNIYTQTQLSSEDSKNEE